MTKDNASSMVSQNKMEYKFNFGTLNRNTSLIHLIFLSDQPVKVPIFQ